MSIFNFSKAVSSCQKGFFLLEGVVSFLFLTTALFFCMAVYQRVCGAVRDARWRYDAVMAASCYLRRLQQGGGVPRAGEYLEGSYRYSITVKEDGDCPSFFWIVCTVTPQEGTEPLREQIGVGVWHATS